MHKERDLPDRRFREEARRQAKLLYAGKVRSGYTEKVAREVRERLDPRISKNSPLDVAVKKPQGDLDRADRRCSPNNPCSPAFLRLYLALCAWMLLPGLRVERSRWL